MKVVGLAILAVVAVFTVDSIIYESQHRRRKAKR